MQILSIGNSFSQDATRYLHQIARSTGEEITTINLYIGGCPLSRHYRNMMSKKNAYALQFNGQQTGFYVSLEDALLSRDWDYITVQQASFGVGRYALSLLWYACLTGNPIDDISFSDFDEAVSNEEIKTVKECVKAVIK